MNFLKRSRRIALFFAVIVGICVGAEAEAKLRFGIQGGGSYFWISGSQLGATLGGTFSAPIAGAHVGVDTRIGPILAFIEYQSFRYSSSSQLGTGSYSNQRELTLLTSSVFLQLKLGPFYFAPGAALAYQLNGASGFFPEIGAALGVYFGKSIFLDLRAMLDLGTLSSSPLPALLAAQLGWTIF